MGWECFGEGKEVLMIWTISRPQGVYGCRWNRFCGNYWWCDCWWKQQDEFRRVQGVTVCPHSATCFKTHCKELYRADGWWLVAYFESNKMILLRQRSGMICNGQTSTWPAFRCVSLAEGKTENKWPPKNKQEVKTAWQNRIREEIKRGPHVKSVIILTPFPWVGCKYP